jgi:hypothetical protein
MRHAKIPSAEVSFSEVARISAKIYPAEVCIAKISSPQVYPFKDNVAKVSASKVGARQACFAKVRY